jgi:hypothetical protein
MCAFSLHPSFGFVYSTFRTAEVTIAIIQLCSFSLHISIYIDLIEIRYAEVTSAGLFKMFPFSIGLGHMGVTEIESYVTVSL